MANPAKGHDRLQKDSRPKKHWNPKNLNLWSGILFGVGLVAFLDEAIFHQLLHWHHFYDQASTQLGLISDGFFHAFSWLATVGGLFLAAHLNRLQQLRWLRWWSGVLLGAGAFQLYDGTIQHKVLRIHQIRYNVNILPYDLTWNAIALLLILAGVFLFRYSQREHQEKEAV